MLLNFLMLALCLVLFPAFSHAELQNTTEAGILVTHGNTRTQNYSAKHKSELKIDKNIYAFSGNFIQSKQSGVENADSWQLSLRYERELSELFSGFASQQVESDIFAGILQRYNTDFGAKRFIVKQPKDIFLIAEAGYRFSREHSVSEGTQYFHKGRAYLEIEKFWHETVSTKFWIEYIPNFTLPNNWLMNSEASLNVAINPTLSLKSGYYLRYNNSPPVSTLTPTPTRTDSTFTTALTAKY